MERAQIGDNGKIKVIFLCIHNSARSQMAEAFLREYGGENFIVKSAGLKKTEINPLVEKVMEEIGISLLGQYSKTIDEALLDVGSFDYVISLCEPDIWQCVTLPTGKHIHWEIPDPSKIKGSREEVLGRIRLIRDGIRNRVVQFVNEVSN